MLRIPSIIEDLGLRPVIHAAGTKTTHGGTRMHPEVIEAMAAASQAFVDIEQLNRAIGARIAKACRAEAGMVTSGAASGVVLSIAACMTGTDLSKVRQLPDATGMRDQVVMQKIHRGAYSHMYAFTGAQIVEVGDMNDCREEEMEAVLSPKTAAIAFLLGPRILRQGLSLPQVVRLARRHGIPVIVDAAAMLPPRSNLYRFIEEGADLVTFSGGKMLHGPQNAGILVGRTSLIEACLANASPHHSIGRPHKVAKETMVGMYAAFERYLRVDEAALLEDYRRRLDPIIEVLSPLADVEVAIAHDDINYNVPVAAITFTGSWRGPSGQEIARKMLAGSPAVFMQFFPSLGHLVVNPISLQPKEAGVVATRLYQELLCYDTSGSSCSARASAA